MRHPVLKAWLLCGALDAVYASALASARAGSVGDVWSGVASGPFGDAAQGWGLGGALLGVAVHFAIMGAMTGAALVVFRHTPLAEGRPLLTGTLFGLALYGIMYGIVLPARFGAPFPNPDKLKLALGLFPHVFFVGIPMALILRRPRVSS